ncbi:MAG: hypothetical protein QM756_29570 [Polyangiaceae bacterium]
MSRSQEPKPEAPITYREQACAVDPGTSREAVEALLFERWQAVKADLATHPSGQLIQIAIFDHAFDQRPQRAPLGTLAWKDWRGDPVIGFPGFGEPSPPVSQSVPPAAQPAPVDPLKDEDTAPIPLQRKEEAKPAEAQAAPAEAAVAVAEPAAVPVVAAAEPAAAPVAAAPVAATGPVTNEPRPAIPGRRRAGEDLISELFELMHELHFARDIVVGAEFVLGVLAEVIPSEYAMVQVFNINTRKFVVVRARGPGAQGAVMHSTADDDALLSQLMRRGGSRAFKTEADARFTSGRFATLKFPVEQLMCGPVRQGGRYLGVIELGNPLGGKPFHETEINALDYICEQFADFVASRPVVLDSDVILGR